MTKIPSRLCIEASSVCQLQCKTCPTGQHKMPVIGQGFLSFNHFKEVIDSNNTIKSIELSNFGEIFLNSQLIDIIRYAYEKGVQLRADNGVNLNTASEELLEALVQFKFYSMTCSIDGASQETYQQYRVNGNFTKVLNNIRKIQHYKKKYRTGFPILTWQYVIFGHNEHEIQAASTMAKQLGMAFRVKLNWDDSFSPVKNNELVKKVTGLKISSRNEFQKHYDKIYLSHTCHQLWDQPCINWNGALLGCCWNYWGDFGNNVFEHSLNDALDSEKMNYAKKMLLGKMPPQDNIPCTTCDSYRHMRSSGVFLDRGVRIRFMIQLKKFGKILIASYRAFRFL